MLDWQGRLLEGYNREKDFPVTGATAGALHGYEGKGLVRTVMCGLLRNIPPLLSALSGSQPASESAKQVP